MTKRKPTKDELEAIYRHNLRALLHNRVRAVELLIQRHLEVGTAHTERAQYHAQRIRELEAHRYQLTKPGFTTPEWRRCAADTSRIEPYVVQASNTVEE